MALKNHPPFGPAPVGEPLMVHGTATGNSVTVRDNEPWTLWFKRLQDILNAFSFECCAEADRWTPTHTNLVNLTVSTPRISQYSLIQPGFVTFSGEFDVTPTLPGIVTSFEMSVPVTSSFSATGDAGGTAGAREVAGQVATIFANTTNGTLQVQWISGDTEPRAMNFSGSYWITEPAPPPFPHVLITTACPVDEPVIDEPYSYQFEASGGKKPYAWSITAGGPPIAGGIIINPATGLLSGTPTESGTFPYTIQVSDAQVPPVTDSTDCEFTIDSPGYTAIGTITIDHTQCGEDGNTLSWPFLFNSTDDAFKLVAEGGYVTSALGYDAGVFFSDSGLTVPLDFEVERWNGITGEFIAWVKIPILSISVDTVIYVGIGNPEVVTSQEDIPGTWDDGGAQYFSAVWHLKNGAVLSLVDSTVNANNGTNTGLVPIEGQIDGAASNPGVAGASVPDNASLRMLKTDLMTWEFLWKSGDLAVLQYPMLKTDLTTTPGWVVRVEIAVDSNAPRLYLYGNFSGDFIYNAGEGLGGSPGINDGAWGILQITYDGSAADTGIRMLWRALPLTMTNPGGSLSNDPTSLSPMLLGYVNNSAMDEIRISKGIVRSDDYATANWNNQINPSAFYALVISLVP